METKNKDTELLPEERKGLWFKHQQKLENFPIGTMEEQHMRLVGHVCSTVLAYIALSTFAVLLMRFFVFLWVSGILDWMVRK